WIARAAALVLLLAVSLARSRPARIAGLVLAVGVVLTVTLTGHADDWGDRSFTVLVDWLHALAATAWTGGVFGLAIVTGPGWATSPASSEPITTVCRRFSRLAGCCLAVVIASGIYNAWAQVPTMAALWTTTYGVALLLKILLALVLAFLGAVNRYLVLPVVDANRAPRLGRWRRVCRVALFGPGAAPEQARARLLRLVGRGAGVAGVGCGLTGLRGGGTPWRPGTCV